MNCCFGKCTQTFFFAFRYTLPYTLPAYTLLEIDISLSVFFKISNFKITQLKTVKGVQLKVFHKNCFPFSRVQGFIDYDCLLPCHNGYFVTRTGQTPIEYPCPNPNYCPYGHVLDACGCCYKCAKVRQTSRLIVVAFSHTQLDNN